ncbi:hypothetical protein Pcinc_002463 [Petrolisthes cinctipes]|uniref:DDE Tnp4 domain-containing protein n=1 Tax=Petrolisthes cinctipes TaxID=88211 RepID=A0AAE1GKY4_PETCI|nr:hypothetical protein Pcinc_002463 [Petrolisthes cinctipes]
MSPSSKDILGSFTAHDESLHRYPGSTHDSFIWNNCALRAKFAEGDFLDCHLLGDSGYPLERYLLTPFANPMTRGEERFNRSHTRTRVLIEQTFGLLKSRFRCLHQSGGSLQYEPRKCGKIITACILLHNRCVRRRIPLPEAEAEAEGGEEEDPDDPEPLEAAGARQGRAAGQQAQPALFVNKLDVMAEAEVPIRREYNQSGAGGSQVPPLDPVDIKVEELLGENNATIEGVMTLDNNVLYDEVRNERTGSQANRLASQEGPAFIEISQDETQLQPLEEEASVRLHWDLQVHPQWVQLHHPHQPPLHQVAVEYCGLCKCYGHATDMDDFAAVESGISIDWNRITCTYTDEPTSHPVDDPATPAMEHEPHIPAVEQESSIDDPPDLPMELEESLDDPAIHNNELQPESEITFQLFEKGTQRGRDKLVDSHGYTYNNKSAAIECNLLAVYCPS